ncbi:competence/damage-inducible protein A [Parvicella tangerina]|uniref:CinA-like protein n=1 Tax=Parvicella tangerina TaxID=2829795 RepID=A0A916NBK7_9FLAO|nr:competence/damage-inducible protein A [Parvicella tangerina]CAG5083422.1 Nicotinamide-nucleotide amidohydrolase PncC [Parvicella tangerina]
MRAKIVNIGDELLIGQTINTNAAWMGEQLDLLGIKVVSSIAIADTREAILEELESASKDAQVILITGGLGPTKDDITKHTLCEYFDSELILNEEVLEGIEEYFKSKGREMLQVNRDQALLPEKCEVLINTRGTASGMWFQKDGVIYVSMPGVPYEMRYLMIHEILPRLKAKSDGGIYHYTVKTIGVGESYLAEEIKEWENELRAEGLKLAYLPSPGIVKLRISGFGSSEKDVKDKVHSYADKLEELIPQYIFGYNKDQLSEIVGIKLLAKEKTLGICESCTGGYLSHLLTSVSGSSAYYEGSMVTYSNELKMRILGVKKETLEEYGAVSEPVVEEMVKGGLKAFGTDYTIAISGIAGPTGGTPDKPVGTVCIAVGSNDEIRTFTFLFGKSRERNIHMSAIYALNELRKMLDD